MDQLVALVSEKTGLSPEISRKAVEVTLNYLKTKLPSPIAGQIDKVLEGDGKGGADLTGGLGSLFGQK